MKCRNCKKNNITKANYCKYCGHKYTVEEQKQARKKTLVGKETTEKVVKGSIEKVV